MTDPSVPTLLFVSQDRQLSYLLERYAGNCGCHLVPMEPGADVITAISHHDPDAVLVDISRSNREGLRVLEALKSRVSSTIIPIILCATSDMDWQEHEADGRLLQPILFSDFLTAIMEAGIKIPGQIKEV